MRMIYGERALGSGVFGAQGTVEPLEAGYYSSKLSRVNGRWLLVKQYLVRAHHLANAKLDAFYTKHIGRIRETFDV